MKTRFLLAVGLSTLSGVAWAQTACPMGATPGSSQCGPSPSYHGVAPVYSTPQTPQVRWADRWGAIAIGEANSGVGLAKSMPSKRKAEKVAMAQCREKGGGCRVVLSNQNQCGVIAWGDDMSVPYGAPTIEKASELGLQDCSKYTTNCRIYYAACSLPERIQ
jgi:hypothetical protein